MESKPLKFVLYCCTFSRDLMRTKRLVMSVQKHNKNKIPFYISVPANELNLFKSALPTENITLLNERNILQANPKLDLDRLYAVPGGIRQQVIKSEFWRLGISENYLVLDADCVFIRDFSKQDFLIQDDLPYSVIHEGRDLLLATDLFGPKKTRTHFYADRNPIQQALGREGITYDFGYAPFLWSAKVWRSLDENYLIPQNKNFLDAVEFCGSEFTWYGEALLAFQAIPIYPREQLFKHYHYEHQLWSDRILGYKERVLAGGFLGIVYQSNWEIWAHFGRSQKSNFSLLWRFVRRFFKKVIFKVKTFLRILFL